MNAGIGLSGWDSWEMNPRTSNCTGIMPYDKPRSRNYCTRSGMTYEHGNESGEPYPRYYILYPGYNIVDLGYDLNYRRYNILYLGYNK